MAENEEQIHTRNRENVIKSELDYIKKRREENGLDAPELDANSNPKDLVGMCISGGGIRSATFGLGVLQTLIRKGILKKVDYLSTVSGGGYIGSCLTSLLTNVSYDDDGKVTPKPPKSEAANMGLEAHNSPFVALNREKVPDDNYADKDNTKMSVMHQIHHLRTHGEYLISKGKGILKRDIQRAFGTTASGIVHHFVLFFLLLVILVCGVHIFVAPFDPNGELVQSHRSNPVSEIENSQIPPSDDLSALDLLKNWWSQDVLITFNKLCIQDGSNGNILKGSVGLGSFFIFGLVWYALWIYFSQKSSNLKAKPKRPVRAGFTYEDDREWSLTTLFNASTVVVCLATVWLVVHLTRSENSQAAFAIFWPLAFAVGGRVASFRPNTEKQRIFSELHQRSLVNIFQGGAFYGIIAGALVPLLIVAVFALPKLHIGTILIAVISLVVARKSQLPEDSGKTQPSMFRKLVAKITPPLGVALGVVLTFSFISDLIVGKLNSQVVNLAEAFAFLTPWWADFVLTLSVAIVAGIILSIFGFKVNANHVSLHYFYRDRLAEAYLRTDARVNRDDVEAQGRALINLRDDERLKLQHMGEGNHRGPYHLVVTALNLCGSSELNRKTMLSEHFLFSRNYIGSDITGYVETEAYGEGNTKLARAMTISAAAAGSASGFHTTPLSSFLFTLFNVRLGYWMENPWYYRLAETQKQLSKKVFWPKYLGIELLGNATARQRLVNLSDGGHTGDNLGLLPLLHRRCKVIIVSDGEADPNHIFESFNNAIRMAFIEENIEISIPNLKNIRPVSDTNNAETGFARGQQSFAIGDIKYPDREYTGKIVYFKSSLSEGNKEHVRNYARNHSSFPHQTTADQFFDDAQFEAYRSLGEHVATSSIPDVKEDGIFT